MHMFALIQQMRMHAGAQILFTKPTKQHSHSRTRGARAGCSLAYDLELTWAHSSDIKPKTSNLPNVYCQAHPQCELTHVRLDANHHAPAAHV